jgi:hypothetical protein
MFVPFCCKYSPSYIEQKFNLCAFGFPFQNFHNNIFALNQGAQIWVHECYWHQESKNVVIISLHSIQATKINGYILKSNLGCGFPKP